MARTLSPSSLRAILEDLAVVQIYVVLAGLHQAGHQRQAAVRRNAWPGIANEFHLLGAKARQLHQSGVPNWCGVLHQLLKKVT